MRPICDAQNIVVRSARNQKFCFFKITSKNKNYRIWTAPYFLGLKLSAQIGAAVLEPSFSIRYFSSPYMFRMETLPLIIPNAKYCPSEFQAHDVILEVILYFCTVLFSSVQNEKSEIAQLTNKPETGLKAEHCIASPCL